MITDDVLVTNRHVVEGALEVQVDTWDGRSILAPVAQVATVADLAIVTLEGDLATTAQIRDEKVRRDEPLVAAGYPGGKKLTFSDGEAVDYQVDGRLGTTEAMLRFTASIRPGNSGGPVLDARGELVGVVFAEEVSTGHALAVPVDVLRDVLRGDQLQPLESCVDS